VLNDILRGPVLVEPAREDALPTLVGLEHVDLHEGAGILDILPRRGSLARAQPQDDIADAHSLAGLERHVARDAVALVEQPDDRDAIGHRSSPRRQRAAIGRGLGHLRAVGRRAIGQDVVDALVVAAGATAGTRAEAKQQRRHDRGSGAPHHASGAHAS